MTFNSHGYIFMILPVTLIGFYLIRSIGVRRNLPHAKLDRTLKLWLIAVSLWFLALFGTRNLLILLVSLVWNSLVLYLLHRMPAAGAARMSNEACDTGEDSVGSRRDGSGRVGVRRTILALGIVADIAFLALFKYNRSLVFPLGISFYTFEQISVLVDAYRGKAGHGKDPMPEVTPLNYLLYLLYYPKLIEGPIARYDRLTPQFDALAGKRFDSEQFLRGAVLFCIGLAKKVLLADVYGGAVDAAFGSVGTLTSLDVIISMVAYSLQLYYDFSGYCDMGEGVSLMLGITLPVNFSSPFKSESPLEFWRRWHATLNDFLTDYVYIPLGGSRQGKMRTYLNTFLVFVISGIWHGNVMTYVFWGLMHGIVATLNRAYNSAPAHGIRRGLRQIGVFAWWTVLISLFPANSLRDWFTYISRLGSTRINLLFTTKTMMDAMIPKELTYIMNASPLVNTPWATVVPCWIMLILGILMAMLPRNSHEIALEGCLTRPRLAAFAVLFVWSVTSLTGVSTFLYTNF